MQWESEALLLGLKPHGESSAVIEVMMPEFDRHLGLLKGARSRRLQQTLQPGNTLLVNWKARLETHLGFCTVELHTARAARLMEGVAGLYGADVCVTDLRAGAALILAGLAAQDTTEVCQLGHLRRGYENIEGKLRSLGGRIDVFPIDPQNTKTSTLPGDSVKEHQ